MFCSKCGAENPETARFCAKCGSALSFGAEPPAAAPLQATMRSSPGAVETAPPAGKTPWVAALLSFFICGLGQLYNNDFKKAAVMFFGAILGFWLTAGVATFAIWVWGMIDGWQVAAGKFNRW